MTAQPLQPTLLGRQPILGRDQQILAYTLVVHDEAIAADGAETLVLSRAGESGDGGAAATASPAGAPDDAACILPLGPYRAFVKVDRDILFSDRLASLPTSLVFLDLDDAVRPTPDVLERCRALRAAGHTLVVRDAGQADAERAPLLALADVVSIDLDDMDATKAADRAREAELGGRVARLHADGKTVLALGVESAERLALGQRTGFDLFRGYYFARPAVQLNRKLNPSQAALLRLLGMVLEDADTGAIENAFKREPGLTLNLLRLTNSVGGGLTTRVTSLRHAIAVLGRRQLQQWLQLLIYAGTGAQSSVNPLLQLAATRGRLMELLADGMQPKNREWADQAFMVGILSLMPALLGVALPDILAQLPVGPRVGLALSEHGGQLGQLLTLVELSEHPAPDDDVEQESALDGALRVLPGINARLLDSRLAQAMQWANTLGQERADHDD